MMLVDTHAHLYASEFDGDRLEMIHRAIQAGVGRIYLPNVDADTIPALLSTCALSDILYPMMGLHPCQVTAGFTETLAEIKGELYRNSRLYYAVGEMGIDLHWDKTTRPYQEEAFRVQCGWAFELDLPVVIHSREATDAVLELLEPMDPRPARGVFHCFSGDRHQVERIQALGNYYFGIGGVITYKNSGLAALVKNIPLDRIVLETDAPYLAPTPFRGKRNEPAFLVNIAESLGRALGLPVDEIEKITTGNALALFERSGKVEG
ncbi:MAG TPA: TatD family hydrolase [Saprospiraceae bacterium]|nr:TatD family hydrolase [Saprospiraceae bacterium]